MRVYIKSAVDDYVERTGWNLKPATSPYAPDLSAAALDQFLNENGEHASMAASFVMKLMCAARMAVPQALTLPRTSNIEIFQALLKSLRFQLNIETNVISSVRYRNAFVIGVMFLKSV